MRILTEAFRDRTFFVPLNNERTEGVFVRPMSATQRRKIQQEALREAGADISIAAYLEGVKLLQRCVADWKGFQDLDGNDIRCTPEKIREVCECEPDFMGQLAQRIQHVARLGELDDEKN